MLPCSKCHRPLDLRFEFGAPDVLELGRRESVKFGFRCPDCGHVNERWSTDLIRYARTLGAVAAPDIVAGLSLWSFVLLMFVLSAAIATFDPEEVWERREALR